MRCFVWLVGMLMVTAAWSFPAAARASARFDTSLGADYRLARFDWNIAGDNSGNNPNILSELTWSDLEISQVSAALRADLGERLVLLGTGDYGEIGSGRNQDSDYGGDNRTAEFSRSNSAAAGNVWDAGFGIGIRFRVLDGAIQHYVHIMPMAGYSIHQQNFNISNGVQTIPASGVIAGLDSSYDAEWKGPWLGMNLRLDADDRTAVIVDMAYHWADYAAEANWNLRDDLTHPVSFRHDAHGAGLVTAVGITHALNAHWEVAARFEGQRWAAHNGTDTTYNVNSSNQVQAVITRLNAVNWKSYTAGLVATYRF